MQGTVEYDISRVKGPLANTFLILINALFFNVKLIGLYDIYPMDYGLRLIKDNDVTFDFIIVGAGAAGCAAAKEITEQNIWTVLVIEAGDYPSPSTEVPGLYTAFPRSKEDWQFLMEKDKNACQGTTDQRCLLTKGKVLGGTSTINDMRYSRGTPEDYDSNDMLQWSGNITHTIFGKVESFLGKEYLQYAYGNSGGIHLQLVNFTGHPKKLLHDAYRAMGYLPIPRRKFIGLTEHLVTILNGERFNMAKAFLTPIKDRPNLFMSKNTEVLGIVCTEPVDKRAVGVNVSIDGSEIFIRARKEVILTAGAVNNAKLLLLSGIGPSAYLQSRKIPVAVDLPGVGKNLQFHLSVPIYVAVDPCENCPKDYYRELDLIGDISEYVIYRRGNLSTTSINEFAAYILTKKSAATLPDIGIYHNYFKVGDTGLLAWLDAMNYHPKIVNSLIKFNLERAMIVFSVTLLKPVSRGEVLLNETHHLSNPKIVPKFLSDLDDWDFETLLRGFNHVTSMAEGEEMARYKAELLHLDIPNCRNFKFCTRKYIKCYVQNMGMPRMDAAGTTKMGEECDRMTVVRSDLEVKSVRCLRVADSSIMGSITMGNTVATDAMIGFNTGEILKEKWLKDYVSPFRPITHDSEG
ncbi:hypothetical protein NQ317_018253 [Molorchus minor]|uniref:Glucose-methanol-choline oxidoreductase N-terminal domain-containing protein n=1 Tax=Molorchus minor TaxID=1323400 RepID=A0ABQ9K5U0_9CUCU|nr:hypothetical protein NQ317_018253 [Molorchus minor]